MTAPVRLSANSALDVRSQFPAIENWHYLDSAATAQKPQAVIDAITNAYARDYATVHRGVFFGTIIADSGDVVTLKEARNCVYWDCQTKGFLGLTTTGPGSGCRVGPATPEITLRGVTSVSKCTPEAIAAWERAPWSA